MAVTFRAAVLGGAFLALALVVACGGSEEPVSPALVIEKPGEKRAPAPGAPSQPAVGAAVELPPGFPRDVPRHPTGRVGGVRMSGDQGISVTLEVAEPAAQVASYYADQFAAEGWSTQVRESQGGTAIFADKDNRSAAATVKETEAGAEVNIIVVEMPRPGGR